jgi:mycothiol synthase
MVTEATRVDAEGFGDIVAVVRALDDAALAADGYPALGDAIWRDLGRPGADSVGFLIPDRAYLHLARSDTFAAPHWTAGFVVHPTARDGTDVTTLMQAAIDYVERHGGGKLVAWVFGASPAFDAQLRAVGFAPTRDLYEMRVPLPRPESPSFPPGITLRDFEPGVDDEAWLVVNNRAFENHPEQGGWIRETLQRRLAEPWFDPTIFPLAFDDKGLAGFNWCKIHPPGGVDPALGEIWVIGVDPRAAGTGLGRALALEGLRRMAARGLVDGSLFTNADNDRAVKLYRSIGFDVHRTDRSYAREVAPA